jgi:hypothetical protein
MADDLKIPMLIWVDDHATRGGAYTNISYARRIGIQVHTFKSTTETEIWIDRHIGRNRLWSYVHYLDFLRKHNNDATVSMRFVTDVVRYEDDGGGMKLNIEAGFTIVKYLRQRLSSIPILVRTDATNVESTKFVTEFSLAGSTSADKVVKQYIDELAGRAEDTNGSAWAHYNAR